MDDDEINPECMDELAKALSNVAPTYVRSRKDPEWNTTKDMWMFAEDIVAYFAQIAVRYSPYTCPDNLEQVLEQVQLVFKPFGDTLGMFEMSLCKISEVLYEHIIPLPQVQAWNERKNGDTSEVKFTSRYTKETDPDDDFIDLDALVTGVCVAVRDERRKQDRFHEKFEKEWKNRLD